MNPETKQDLLAISHLMIKSRELKEAEKATECEDTKCKLGEEGQGSARVRLRQDLLPLETTADHALLMDNVEAGIVAGIEKYLVSTEEWRRAEELLLATWLLCRKDLNFSVTYNHCQTRRAIRFTFDDQCHFVNGICWDYDIDNDELGELLVEILGHDFMHQAVWDRYSDSWFEAQWIKMDGDYEVCKELDEVLNRCVYCGGCDEFVFDEEPYVDSFILANAFCNTKRQNHFCYLLVDGNNHVYMASDKKRDEEGTEYWQVINGWAETVALLPLGRLRVISEEECTRLLLQQELIISDGFGNSEDMIWSPKEKRLMGVCKSNSVINTSPETCR